MKEKLIDALKTIKGECEKHSMNQCSECPLGNDSGDCLINDLVPENWKINEPDKVWRALS